MHVQRQLLRVSISPELREDLEKDGPTRLGQICSSLLRHQCLSCLVTRRTSLALSIPVALRHSRIPSQPSDRERCLVIASLTKVLYLALKKCPMGRGQLSQPVVDKTTEPIQNTANADVIDVSQKAGQARGTRHGLQARRPSPLGWIAIVLGTWDNRQIGSCVGVSFLSFRFLFVVLKQLSLSFDVDKEIATTRPDRWLPGHMVRCFTLL